MWLNGEMYEGERKNRGWEAAYNLTTWTDYPGVPNLMGILLQNLSGGLLGSGGGKKNAIESKARDLRKYFK